MYTITLCFQYQTSSHTISYIDNVIPTPASLRAWYNLGSTAVITSKPSSSFHIMLLEHPPATACCYGPCNYATCHKIHLLTLAMPTTTTTTTTTPKHPGIPSPVGSDSNSEPPSKVSKKKKKEKEQTPPHDIYTTKELILPKAAGIAKVRHHPYTTLTLTPTLLQPHPHAHTHAVVYLLVSVSFVLTGL